ncbi:PEP/pyruvate-binding domain-containing protein, partial [Candidatus Fermentibacterales bacterium]|nr:PEP/pyruvate-binding domain-containing protein [Candidatus Fermentibacterales bacterium]
MTDEAQRPVTKSESSCSTGSPQEAAPPSGSPYIEGEWKVIINLLRDTNPIMLQRIGRKMMNYLFKRNVRKIGELMSRLADHEMADFESGAVGENVPARKVNLTQLESVVDEVFRIAEEELTSDQLTSMIRIWLRDETTRFLFVTAEKRDVSLSQISEAVERFVMLPENQRNLSPEDSVALRVALIRRFLSEDLFYINTMKKLVTVLKFGDLLESTIGPPSGNGKLGGKAAGLLRAEMILKAAQKDNIILRNLTVPKTWFITSDAILEFIHHNALEELLSIKYCDPNEIRQEHVYLRQIFKNSALPSEIMTGLSMALDDLGEVPLVVRSSSLLEDSVGASFAGKYRSLFVANIGTKEERLEALADAVLEVYASVFGPDPIEYRRERGLLDFNEEMGILIQEVVGRRVGDYFFPAYAGVAFSKNEFRWSPRIGRDDGIIRLVTGLGTRAVDRTGSDFPVLVSPGQPGLRVNVTPEETMRYAQKSLDVINLASRRFETVDLEPVIREHPSVYPSLAYIISLYTDGELTQPMGNYLDLDSGAPVVTFRKLLDKGPF